MREYVILREFGHASIFGEGSISELTELQSRLLSISHLYDIIQQSVSQHNSYGEDKTEVPDYLKPYPTKLSKWFDKWQDSTYNKMKKDGSGNKSGEKNRISRSKWVDNETDEEAFAAYIAGQKALEAGKNK